MSNLIPFEFDSQQVRTVLIDDQPWFVAVDVCGALGLADTNKALIGLDEDEKREHEQYSGSGRKPILINESGLYSLILRSRKAEAKRFKKWVTAEVLPAIRKTGQYTQRRMSPLQAKDAPRLEGGLASVTSPDGSRIFSWHGKPIRVVPVEGDWLFCLDDIVYAWTNSKNEGRLGQAYKHIEPDEIVEMTLNGKTVWMKHSQAMWAFLDRTLYGSQPRIEFFRWFRQELIPALRSELAKKPANDNVATGELLDYPEIHSRQVFISDVENGRCVLREAPADAVLLRPERVAEWLATAAPYNILASVLRSVAMRV